MALGDYDARDLTRMAQRAASLAMSADGLNGDPQRREGLTAEVVGMARNVAIDALRVLPQLSAGDLQICAAFRLDPFTYLAAKLEHSEAVAIERQERIDRTAAEERYQRDMEAWGNAEIERMRKL